jgi:hypothetical protein
MKYGVRDAVARSNAGRSLARADRMIAWIDRRGYAIVDKDSLNADATPAATSTIKRSPSLTDSPELQPHE